MTTKSRTVPDLYQPSQFAAVNQQQTPHHTQALAAMSHTGCTGVEWSCCNHMVVGRTALDRCVALQHWKCGFGRAHLAFIRAVEQHERKGAHLVLVRYERHIERRLSGLVAQRLRRANVIQFALVDKRSVAECHKELF
jgi:hypothetical protein